MTLTHPRLDRHRTVVVGGVAGGMSTATRLRRNDEHREIVVLERGAHVSFANCGLPYHLSGVIPERSDLLLSTPEALRSRFDLDVRTGHEVLAIDTAAQVVTVRDLAAGTLQTWEYDDLVLATGARPVRPPVPGIARAHALRDIADLDSLSAALDARDPAGDVPATAVVIGAGFVGLEVAENLARRGLAVTVVELAPQVLTPLDAEMAALVEQRLTAVGTTVRTGSQVVATEQTSVLLDDGTCVPADLVVVAIGVTPESDLARAAGLDLHPHGGIVVDDQQRTSDPRVYAVGDVCAKTDAVSGDAVLVPLAQAANRHGRLVADVLAGRPVRAVPSLGAAVVSVHGTTVGLVGWNERRLRAAGRSVRAIHTHPLHHVGYYPGAQPMALKLLVDPGTDQILGAQGVGGDGVDKVIDVIATAMRGGLTASDLADLELVYAPQYGSAKSPVAMLGMVADNLAGGTVRTVQWHEVARQQADGATLVDVRSPAEVAAGTLPGAVAIPLDDLRARHAELPAGPLVVFCAVGQRGNVATRLLQNLGHDDVANLDGGYRTWSTAPAVRVPEPALA